MDSAPEDRARCAPAGYRLPDEPAEAEEGEAQP